MIDNDHLLPLKGSIGLPCFVVSCEFGNLLANCLFYVVVMVMVMFMFIIMVVMPMIMFFMYMLKLEFILHRSHKEILKV